VLKLKNNMPRIFKFKILILSSLAICTVGFFLSQGVEQFSANLISAINDYANKLNDSLIMVSQNITNSFSNVSSASLSKVDDASPIINEMLDMAIEIPQFFGAGIINSISYIPSAMLSIIETAAYLITEEFAAGLSVYFGSMALSMFSVSDSIACVSTGLFSNGFIVSQYVFYSMFSVASTTSLASLDFLKTELSFSQFLGASIIDGFSRVASSSAELLSPVKDFWLILAKSFFK